MNAESPVMSDSFNPMDYSLQAPLSMEFSRQEYWSELSNGNSWVPKNWCFWTVVLEKTLESPLDCKEIQPVHSEGDQLWVFFGRNDAKAETPVLWPPHAKSSLRFTSIELVIPSSHLILSRPLLLLPPIPPRIRVFSNESTLCMRWPKYWSFSFSISPSKEHPGLISFRMDWLDLLAVQGTLKSLLQHHSSKA